MQHDYQDRLDYLYGRLDYERLGMPRIPGELRLRRMRRLLRKLGDPHLELPIIHVAGTKGKGSTAAMLAAVLTASGVRTGLYCSPHLHRLEERFSVDGNPASQADLVEMVDVLRDTVEQLELDAHNDEHRGATFFEITTAMGLLYLRSEASVRSCSKSAWGVDSIPPTSFTRRSRSSRAFLSTTHANLAIPWRRSRLRRPEFSSAGGRRSAACESPRRPGDSPRGTRAPLHSAAAWSRFHL